MSHIDVRDDPEHHRYLVTVDGTEAGGAYYRLEVGPDGTAVVFTHTEVSDAFGGQGVGSRLARAALDDVRATGRTAVPQCPFIAAYIAKHPEYRDLVTS